VAFGVVRGTKQRRSRSVPAREPRYEDAQSPRFEGGNEWAGASEAKRQRCGCAEGRFATEAASGLKSRRGRQASESRTRVSPLP
jgi:hypothetical protein